MKRHLLRTGLLGALLLTMALAIFRPPSGVYPSIEILVPDPHTPITIRTAFEEQPAVSDCEALTGNIVRVTLARCPDCRIVSSRCDTRLSQANAKLLGAEPVPHPSGRLRNGALAFLSEDTEAAQQACDAAARNTAATPNPVTCHSALEARQRETVVPPFPVTYLLLPFLAGITAWLVGWLIIRYEHLHGHLTHDAVDGGPQKTHASPAPRVGGAQVMAGLVAGWLVLSTYAANTGLTTIGLMILCAMPAFVGGLVEDVTKKVGVLERLLMTMLSGALACWLLGAVVDRVDIPLLDRALAWLPLSVAFTSFAVAGIANSINIIDGFHGLASGTTMITTAAIAFVGWQVGDAFVLTPALLLLGALAGFFVWNWPRGLIFLGDGGAYLVGTLLAQLSILLVLRNPSVSPWLPLALLSHPFVETISSITRRLFSPQALIGQPDTNHLHHRVHKRLYANTSDIASSNHRVAKFFWVSTTGASIMAIWCSNIHSAPAIVVFAYATTFLGAYYWSRPGQS
jgi:UDP-GlcNAc:undecaprenyl-phosphate GlcNAc-1-phosphate transferase